MAMNEPNRSIAVIDYTSALGRMAYSKEYGEEIRNVKIIDHKRAVVEKLNR